MAAFRVATVGLSATALVLWAAPALGGGASGGCADDGDLTGCLDSAGGVDVGLSQTDVSSLSSSYPPSASPGSSSPTAWYEYVAVINCPQNSPDQPKLEICLSAAQYCEANVPGSSGPHSTIYRREVTAAGSVGGWREVGPTCYTDAVPSRSGEAAAPVLTEDMVLEAFHRTDFALPQTILQPPDGQTLVNLPVYFQLSWPEAGFEPTEIDTVDIVGRSVRIRPTLTSITYVTGDGGRLGPTTSLGGPYPSGDITHEYREAGTVNPHIEVVYGGEYSVDGGSWNTLPGTATVTGPDTALEVRTSRNRLYSN